MRKLTFSLALATLALTVGTTVADAAPGETLLVSSDGAGSGGNDHSNNPSISADGRFVAFESIANNLSNEDNDIFNNIFVRDLVTGTTTLVSRASGPVGPAGNADSDDPSISADGRIVAFVSDADNLSSGDGTDIQNVFVRDLQANTTTLISRGIGGQSPDSDSFRPSISADGRRIAFTSLADNLGSTDANGTFDIFVRDLVADTTILASQEDPSTGGGPVAGDSDRASLSADGTVVAFQSRAANLSPLASQGVLSVYVRSLGAGTTTLVSTAAPGVGANGAAETASISGDGSRVAFRSSAENLGASAANPNIYVREVAGGPTGLVSADPGAGVADDRADDPSISADGRFVAFSSKAEDLSVEDANVEDVFIRDLAAGTTTVASRSTAGVAADDESEVPVLSADGRFVAFDSEASNLSDADRGLSTDVFRRELSGGAASAPPVADGPTASCAGKPVTAVGTEGSDKLRGTPGVDVIAAGGGNDVVKALGGADLVCGGDGNDRLAGAGGKDKLMGGAGRDVLVGGAGKDKLTGGPGRDRERQ